MIATVIVVAMASITASSGWFPVLKPNNARNDSSGPYAQELKPSTPNPTHARNGINEIEWNIDGSLISRGAPNSMLRKRPRLGAIFSNDDSSVDSTGSWCGDMKKSG